MAVRSLDHVNIDTCRLDETVAFYRDVLGLQSRPKPSGNPGVWLYCGDQAIVHINVVESDEESMTPGTGRFNHVAFEAASVDELCGALDRGGHAYKRSSRPDLGITQLFTTDPNGVSVELNVPMP